MELVYLSKPFIQIEHNIILPEKFYEPLYEHTHTRLTALFPGLPRWAGTRKVKPIWILLKQEKVSGIGISWAICKSAPHSRQITMPAPHRSVFYRPDALPAAQPTASKHWMSIYSKKKRQQAMYRHQGICMTVITVTEMDCVGILTRKCSCTCTVKMQQKSPEILSHS